MTFYDFFEILTEVLVQRDMRTVGLRRCDAFVDRTSMKFRRLDQGQGCGISLNDDLSTLAHLFQYRVQIARQFGFANVELRHIFDDTSSLDRRGSSGRPPAGFVVTCVASARRGRYGVREWDFR